MNRAVGLALALLATGCVHPRAQLNESTPVYSAVGELELKSTGKDPVENVRVANALVAAGPAVQRWGGLEHKIEVQILPTHEALERAVRRRGFAWLRAWGRYDEILLQSPRSWAGPPPTDADLAELLTHELTHCLMFQRSAGPDDWTERKIPIWFREGMASWTANQGYRRPSLADLARELSQRPPLEVFTDGEALSRTQERFVYGMAHHAFSFLVRRYGEPGVARILSAMREGRIFREAFAAAIGIEEDAFAAEFERFLRWGGHKRGAPVRRPLMRGDAE
jgi:hypothetical protein